jgi:hypothetical protein
MSFEYTFRSSDMDGLEGQTADLMENRDQELELWLKFAVPTGGIIRWHGTSIAVPAGWLRTNGASVSRITYTGLFAVIGYTYGGSGANFTLPTVTDHIIRY